MRRIVEAHSIRALNTNVLNGTATYRRVVITVVAAAERGRVLRRLSTMRTDRSMPRCKTLHVSSSQHFADLQPATERIGLTERLDEERRAVLAQARDLSADEIQARPLTSTDLSIGRIVKHLAFTEDRWFEHKLLGLDLPEPWRSIDPREAHDWSFRSADLDPLDDIVNLYENACRRSRDATQTCASMEALAVHPSFGNKPVNLRWLLADMIDETSRHSGHIDLIRDALGRPPAR